MSDFTAAGFSGAKVEPSIWISVLKGPIFEGLHDQASLLRHDPSEGGLSHLDWLATRQIASNNNIQAMENRK
jgi:hypothetical protein